MLRVIIAYATVIGAIIALIAMSYFYELFRLKTSSPKIGFENFSSKYIKKGDYVCINGRVRQFDHWTSDNEIIDPLNMPLEDNKTSKGNLAFSTNSLGYNILPSSLLKNCEFIYGKYGLKWAISEEYAYSAEEKIREYQMKY